MAMSLDSKVMWTFVLTNLFVLASGIILIAQAFVWRERCATPTTGDLSLNLILGICPLKGAIFAGALVITTSLSAIFGLRRTPSSRTYLMVHAYALIACAVTTLILGLLVWFITLIERADIANIWTSSSPTIQATLQDQFKCCGYWNATNPGFVQSQECPDVSTASGLPGCVTTFVPVADLVLNRLFTTSFGFVGLDCVSLLAVLMLIKVRGEQERYRRIDEKLGVI
ncbi:hypothetical protein SAICODRAFT_16219 [Saitoella complicata NRRL Y-17804]|uniref:uncharacterized protein n=1 Tax=Saitoella complicata (strain BCRC 22490 / CBS 7301 / JCM 7358 / NBRC 10748 / NRRL Y-17804) TaxID=698492 RepID=UPI000867C72A|nr:uncharacterized protein SAICODRAFT_16219 [Saitoella complicata NRRL Y-17804]ODQ56191.1 hypothetical protein SAICODRAFT_16219 [Saitoella complicata NRRL Y-17804]